jgi:S-(hydroxymethyl)glutathione dehydrogenase/alcohol dehydrogenase
VREVGLLPPGPEEVLVKMEMAGLCRSDLNAINGHTRYEMPLVLGHEGVGTVVETGADVKDMRPGQRVALSWAAYCGRCYFCERGETELCSTVAWPRGRGLLPDGTTRFCHCDDGAAHAGTAGGKEGAQGLGGAKSAISENGAKGERGESYATRGSGAAAAGNDAAGGKGEIYHFNGVSSFSEYTVLYRTGCVPLPMGTDPVTAAMAGCPVVTAFGAVFRTAAPFMREGMSALVVGGGSVGRAVVEALRLRGAGLIILVVRDRSKWNKQGVGHYSERIERDEILGLTRGIGVDMAFDCVATAGTVRRSLEAVRRGGTVVMVGSPHPLLDLTLPAVDFHLEKRLMGSLYGSARPDRDIPWILGLMERGEISLDPCTGGVFGLEDINNAVKALENGGGRVAITF